MKITIRQVLLLIFLWSVLNNSEAYNLFPTVPLTATSKTTITADHLSFNEKNYSFTGKVKSISSFYYLSAERLNLSQASMLATDNIKYQSLDLQLSTNKISSNNNTKQVRATSNKFSLLSGQINGQSELMTITSNVASRIQQVKFSTCPVNQEIKDWHINAETLTIDNINGWAIAKNLSFQIKNIPIFYLPILTFPIDQRRKSGLLIPNIESSTKQGINLAMPYYWNISNNIDYLGEVNFIEKRGIWNSAKLRYLTPQSFANFYVEGIELDQITKKSRNFLAWQQTGTVNSNLNYKIDFNRASDINYFKDFNSKAFASNTEYLNQMAKVQYSKNNLVAQIKTHQFQSLNKNESKYKVMPQINLNWQASSYAILALESTDFKHNDHNKTTGNRLNSSLNLQTTFAKSYGSITPLIYIDTTQYNNLTNFTTKKSSYNSYTFALDNKLFFERDLSKGWIQTLTPRLYYAKRNNSQTTQIPNFDSGKIALSYQSLFDHRIYTGKDKSGELDRISLGVESQFINDGNSLLRLNIAQGYDLITKTNTNLITGINLNYDRWSLNSTTQFEPSSAAINKNTISTSYIYDENYQLKFDYTDDKLNKSSQNKLSGRSKINNQWQIFASRKKSNNIVNKEQLGLTYSSCCWQILIAVSNELKNPNNINPNQIEYDQKFYFTIDLKGLLNSRINDYITTAIK